MLVLPVGLLMDFTHLHVHSQYSLLDGTMPPGEIAKVASELEMRSVALTDTCNLYGAVAFYKACKKAGVRPILGAELFVQEEGTAYEDPRREEGGFQLIALVEDPTGYANLCELVTRAIFDGMFYKPRIDLELLQRHHEGLIFLTGGRKGAFGRSLIAGDTAAAEQRLERLAFLGPERLYLELQDHGLPGQELINDGVRRLAASSAFQTVATNAVHYRKPTDSALHEVLNAIALGCSMSDPSRIISPTDQAWMKTGEEMAALFPDDLDAIRRTVEIGERCEYHFDFNTYHFPATTPPDVLEDGTQPDTERNWEYFYKAFPPPVAYGLPAPEVAIPPHPDGAGNLAGYFDWYCKKGLELRLEHIDEELHAEYWPRLAYEVETIGNMGFPAYMLIVAEFINWSKDNEIPVGPGRGSAAGSLVAWAMRITDIDPIRYGLVFERFLNIERVSMPDIDVDFCQDRREEAIEHVRDKYGAPLVSQIITYGTLKAKAAVRDVSRVLNLNFKEADRIAKLIPDTLGIKLQTALDEVETLRAMRGGDPKVRRAIDTALGIEGMTRQTGVHAAGVVIADRPLVAYAPLYRDEPEGGPVVQYDMKSAESIGLIKFDFLGLKTLDQIRDALVWIRQNHGVDLDMSQLPVDDEKTYTLLQRGDALGVFQLESEGMRNLLVRLRPSVVDDMVALVALYRPGPLQSGMTDDFVERKHGRTRVEYPLPQLEPILKGTYGTIIYQEQVMQIAQVMAGYTLGEADLLRRAMGKKKHEEMAKQKTRFVTGSIDAGIDEQIASDIFDMMAKFAAYGFNKSHSAAYGYISYQTAYLKAHYRPEFMSALMTSEASNTDKIITYLGDCRKFGVDVLPASVNDSIRAFYPPKGSEPAIRFGLCGVKNVGGAAIEAIVQAREECGGAFRSAYHFFEKIDYRRVNRRVIESLIKVGAFDWSGVSRAALLAGLESAISSGTRAQEDELSGQGSLFASLAPTKRPDFRFPAIPEAGLPQKLAQEHEVLGFYLTGHPMEAYQEDVERFGSIPLHQLRSIEEGMEVRLVAIPGEARVIRTRRGDKMAFVRLEDHVDAVEAVFFADAWARSQRVLGSGRPVLVVGNVEGRGEKIKLRATTAEDLEEVRVRSTRLVTLRLDASDLAGDRAGELRRILEQRPGGCRTRLQVSYGDLAVHYDLPKLSVDASTELEERITALFGRRQIVSRA